MSQRDIELLYTIVERQDKEIETLKENLAKAFLQIYDLNEALEVTECEVEEDTNYGIVSNMGWASDDSKLEKAEYKGALLGSNDYPRYKKISVVQAAQIFDILPYDNGDATLYFEDNLSPVWVRKEWVERHDPSVGRYFVILEDGSRVCISRAVFENGHELLMGGVDAYL